MNRYMIFICTALYSTFIHADLIYCGDFITHYPVKKCTDITIMDVHSSHSHCDNYYQGSDEVNSTGVVCQYTYPNQTCTPGATCTVAQSQIST